MNNTDEKDAKLTTSTDLTSRNLEQAFAGESMANRKYLYFAKLARQLGDEEVAALFRKKQPMKRPAMLSPILS